jgi:hypothetical protein
MSETGTERHSALLGPMSKLVQEPNERVARSVVDDPKADVSVQCNVRSLVPSPDHPRWYQLDAWLRLASLRRSATLRRHEGQRQCVKSPICADSGVGSR